jgi:hypothetical protein
VGLLADRGRLREALETAEAVVGHSRRAGLGPWSRASDEARRLRVLYLLGEAGRVLADAGGLLARLDALPATRGPDDTVAPWNVRELVLQLAARAAGELGRWEQALAFTARMRESLRARGAGEREIAAMARFGDYGPLLRLGRLGEADALLADCQRVFDDAGDAVMLGRTFSARAGLAAGRGRHAEAARLEQVALRLHYTRPDPAVLAVSHHNLAGCLGRAGDGGPAVLAHRFAAALLYRLTGAAFGRTGPVSAAGHARERGAGRSEGTPARGEPGVGLAGRRRYRLTFMVYFRSSAAGPAAVSGSRHGRRQRPHARRGVGRTGLPRAPARPILLDQLDQAVVWDRRHCRRRNASPWNASVGSGPAP